MTNLEAVQGGLRIVRDALTPWIAQNLQSEYGKDWWKKGVLDALVADGKPITDRPEQGDAGDLDLQTALKIVQVYHWELFSDNMDWGGRQRSLLAAITGVRNQYEGHVTPNREAELTDEKVRDLMGGMESFLLLFDRKAADQLGRLTEKWKLPQPELEEEEEPVITARRVLTSHRSEPERITRADLPAPKPLPKTESKPMHPILGSAKPMHPVMGAGTPEMPKVPPKEEEHGFAPKLVRPPKKEETPAASRSLLHPEPAERLYGRRSLGGEAKVFEKNDENRQESREETAKEAIPRGRREKMPPVAEEKPARPIVPPRENDFRLKRADRVEHPAAQRSLLQAGEEKPEPLPPAVEKAREQVLRIQQEQEAQWEADRRPDVEPYESVPLPRKTPRSQRRQPYQVQVSARGKRKTLRAEPVLPDKPAAEFHLAVAAKKRLILFGIVALIVGIAIFILDQYLGKQFI